MDERERGAALRAHEAECVVCERCALSGSRTGVVVGEGSASAELMLVADAPGYLEDQAGLTLTGPARDVIERLLGSIGVALDHVYVTPAVKCRAPGNRDVRDEEIAACEPLLFRQVALVRPRVVATLGNVATRLLSGRPDGITRMHGHPLPVRIGELDCTLFPLFHPAAALYTSGMLELLEEDVRRLGELLSERAPGPIEAPDVPEPRHAEPAARGAVQLGLF